ncbi:sensor histidine kinase [Streptomyces fradiae]|uniref:sensor histidine kinase n=1 Tax=Streptomyces fradiae TaxID=1906 RepID=UPI003F4D58D0
MADAIRSREESGQARETAQRELIAMERRHAAAAERASIARELHDIVAHAVSVIAVQAESATYTTPNLSPEAREGFQQIAGSARSALSELRQLLTVLRTDGPSGKERAPVVPQPTMESLGILLATHRLSGGEVDLRTEGTRPVALPPSLELTVYRIVQEALTNARRHAPGARVLIRLDYSSKQLRVRIVDDGPGPRPLPPPGKQGYGLSGMQERASLLGGRLAYGAAGPEGGFLIQAELPVRADARSLMGSGSK